MATNKNYLSIKTSDYLDTFEGAITHHIRNKMIYHIAELEPPRTIQHLALVLNINRQKLSRWLDLLQLTITKWR
jgi:hypothetical protein